MEKTEAELQKRLERILNEKDKSIALSYARVLNELRAELAKLYEKYEKEGKLSYVEMARHNQLKQLFLHIGEILSDCTDNTRDVLEELFGETYLEGFYRTAWAIETEALCALGYPAVTSNVIKKMLNNKIQGLTLNERLERNRKKIIHTIQTEITQGLVKNETYGMMAKRLKKTLEGDAVKAMRIVRTEVHRVQEKAKHDAAEHANNSGVVMVKKWNNRMDERSRPTHRAADGQTVAMDEDFKVGSAIGSTPGELSGGAKENVNCACFLTYEILEVQKPTDKRLADVTFKEWKEKFDNDKMKVALDIQFFVKIPKEKFTQYALNPLKSPDKAKAFESALGYNLNNYQDLIDKIDSAFDKNKLKQKGDNGYGMRYEQIMDIQGPNGKTAKVLTAWIDNKNSGDYRLVSAYIDKRKGGNNESENV